VLSKCGLPSYHSDSELASDFRFVAEDFPVQDHRLAAHRHGLEAELLNQFEQRVGTAFGIVVKLGGAGLVDNRRGIEPPRQQFAAGAIRGFQQDRLTGVFEFFFEEARGDQTAGAAAENGYLGHELVVLGRSIVPGQPVKAVRRRTKILSFFSAAQTSI
jgi:hypothetical protein